METELPPKEPKKQTAQEVFKRLREKSKIQMAEKMEKIMEAQDRARANITEKMKKTVNDNDNEEWPRNSRSSVKKDSSEIENLGATPVSANVPFPRPPSSITMKSENPDDTDRGHIETIETQPRSRKRRGRCTNCCGGLTGKGSGSARDVYSGYCYCYSENRLRGGSDSDRSIRHADPTRTFRVRSFSDDSRVSRRSNGPHCCGYSTKIPIVLNNETRYPLGQVDQYDSFPMNESRVRGGCGNCGVGSSSNHQNRHTHGKPTSVACQQWQTEYHCHETSRPSIEVKGGCPCGGCGGSACSDNPGNGGIEGGCCGGNRPRGKPCKCKCQSCDTFRPLGGCGGKSCGRIYSCAGSGGGRCCFPRNHKRRSGPDCCGGADSNCGGCC